MIQDMINSENSMKISLSPPRGYLVIEFILILFQSHFELKHSHIGGIYDCYINMYSFTFTNISDFSWR